MNLAKAKPHLQIASKPSLDWAAAYLAGERPPKPVTPTDHAILNEEVCFCAVAAAFHQDMVYVHRLLSHVPALLASTEGFWEYVYGRAGLLYLLRIVRAWFPESADLVNPAIASIAESILKNGPPWNFGGQGKQLDMLGMGHGRMGIIVQILLCDAAFAPRVKDDLVAILDLQQDNGNWPVRWPGSEGASIEKWFVQWCHGAPGIVQGLVMIRELYPDLQERIDAAIEKGRQCTWEKGLLTKEPNLCHGITGNAFAFPPGEKRDHFLAYTTEERVRGGYEDGTVQSCDYGIKWSLGFGGIGRAVGWMWRDKEKACYLGFDDV